MHLSTFFVRFISFYYKLLYEKNDIHKNGYRISHFLSLFLLGFTRHKVGAIALPFLPQNKVCYETSLCMLNH